jgi:hypothetical protein
MLRGTGAGIEALVRCQSTGKSGFSLTLMIRPKRISLRNEISCTALRGLHRAIQKAGRLVLTVQARLK